jgi:RND family efflux transporter MFP subunit
MGNGQFLTPQGFSPQRFARLTGICVCICAAISGCGPAPAQSQLPPPKPPEVTVSKVVTRKVTDYEDFPGRIEAINAVEIRTRVTGFVTKVNFREGSIVKQGDVLFEIDPRPYKAEFDRTGGVVLQMDGRLKRLDADLARAKNLKAIPGAMSQEDFDKIVGDHTEAEGNLKVAKANLETAKLKLDWTKVEAPLTGKISRRYVDPGNLVKEDDTVLTSVVDFDPIYAYFDVDERTTLRVQKLIRDKSIAWSMEGKLPVFLGLPDEKDHLRKGFVHFADNRIDPDTGTWRLRGKFDNKDDALAAGLFVRIRLPIGVEHDAKLIPEQALNTDQGQKFVYVVDKDNKVSSRRVKVGPVHLGMRTVVEGLEAGERIIVNGLQRARPGIEVTPVEKSEVVQKGVRTL